MHGQENNNIVVQYVDAFYSYRRTVDYDLIPHTVIGEVLIATPQYLTLCFSRKNKKPWRGLLIPLSVIGSKNTWCYHFRITKHARGKDVGVSWSDLTYFEDGAVPSTPTSMYSEGELIAVTKDSVVLGKPETLQLGKLLQNRLDQRPSRLIIPRGLITDMHYYEKK